MAAPAATTALQTDDDLRDAMARLIADPTSIERLSDEDVIALKTRINPVGTFAPAHKSYAVMSVMNMREDSARKLITTAMIAFLYRRLFEYVPAYITAHEVESNARIARETDQARRDAIRAESEAFVREHTDAQRRVVRAFLDSIFAFDVDKHVRAAPSKLPMTARDIIEGRVPTQDPALRGIIADIARARADPRVSAPIVINEESPAAISDAAQSVYRAASGVSSSIAQAIGILARAGADGAGDGVGASADTRAPPIPVSDAVQLLHACRTRVDGAATAIAPLASGAFDECANALTVSPPADLFFHFGRYFDSHYDILRVISNTIYDIPPGDFENAVIYYDAFNTTEEAREFVRVHEAEFSADPKVIENGAVTLLGPFRENREIVDFYNRNTELLRQLMEQTKRDNELGKNISKNRVKEVTARSIREAGPADPGLEKYIAARNIVHDMQSDRALTREERAKLLAAQQTVAEAETPDGALAIRILKPALDADGRVADLDQQMVYAEGTHGPGGK